MAIIMSDSCTDKKKMSLDFIQNRTIITQVGLK